MAYFSVETDDDIKIEHSRYNSTLSFRCRDEQIFKSLTVKDCIEHFGEHDFLEEIGEEKAIEHFNLEVSEDD